MKEGEPPGLFKRLTIAKIAFAKVTSRICNANATPLFVRVQTSMPGQIGITDFHYDSSYTYGIGVSALMNALQEDLHGRSLSQPVGKVHKTLFPV